MEHLQEKITRCRVFIIRQVRYVDIRDYLLQEGGIERHDDEEIKSHPVQRDQMSLLLSKLETKGANAHNIFLDALREDHGHVVDEIMKTEIVVQPAETRIPLEGEIDTSSIMQLSNHHLVMDKWKMLGRVLEVKEADISQIAYAQRDNLRECVYNMLSTWQGQNRRCDASKECIYKALADIGIRQAGDEVFYS